MKKEVAIKTISECAKYYHEHLENKNILFLFDSQQNLKWFEAVFLPRHFLHLTGVETQENSFSGSSDFYKKALKSRLSPKDFSFASNGTTEMKLSILPYLMDISRSAKMVGDFDFSKSVLYTEKLVGNVSAALGFVCEDHYYIPNTALKEDIRDITAKPQKRMLAILRKPVNQPCYQEICYMAKGLTLQDISLPADLKNKVLIPQNEAEQQNMK